MTQLHIGFSLGNLSRQLAGNLLRRGVDLTVGDVDAARTTPFVAEAPTSLSYAGRVSVRSFGIEWRLSEAATA